MDKVILHSDLNSFYATVEELYRPELRGKPMAVCGNAELRHGIVLAKNICAKERGIRTGEAIWEAKTKAPDLEVIIADFGKYLRFSKIVRNIYAEYSDQVESFGIDECWLDITGQDGEAAADELRERVKAETGCTVSVGVSWNKIFAKLGSDMKKPDATTVITKDNFKQKIWPLPAEELLGVGGATKKKLNSGGIYTIGDIANADLSSLKCKLGKWGEHLWAFANGNDTADVVNNRGNSPIKSVSNSATAVRDLKTAADVRMIVTVLSESVAARLRIQWFKGYVISLNIRDKNLKMWGKQCKLDCQTNLSETIIKAAMELFQYYPFTDPIRSIGVAVSDLVSVDASLQTDIFFPETERLRRENLESSVDGIRRCFGHYSLNRAIEYLDRSLTNFDPKGEEILFRH